MRRFFPGRSWNHARRLCAGAVFAALGALWWSVAAAATPVSTATEVHGLIGKHLQYLPENGAALTPAEAAEAYARGKFTPARNSVLNFGIGAPPVWLALEVTNPGPASAVRRLAIETSWLDRIEVHFRHAGREVASRQAGDAHPFGERALDSPFFWFDHAYAPGTTTVLIRVQTPDPMVLPVYFTSVETAHQRLSRQETSYGLLYGFLLALLAYNFFLFLSLKAARYLYYSVYLLCFSIMNFTYTGHSFRWLWPEAPQWQQWSNPILMMVYAFGGLLFAMVFLETRTLLPRLHRIVVAGMVAFALAQAGAVLAGSQVAALLVSFVLVFLFTAAMVLLGARAYLAGLRAARYFLLASVTAAIGATITAAAVWGLIPFTVWTYRAVDVSMAIDATLLALALADQFRISQEERIRAEQLAHVDPLTGINNRRAFLQLVAPIWNTEQRHRRDLSVLLLDMDRFKSINDIYGHAVGDQVLIAVANLLRQGMRNGDVVARWGGEEFIVFLPETTPAAACNIAERLRAEIAALPVEIDGQRLTLTATFGVAHSDDPKTSLENLISIADHHLYEGKQRGRNQVYSG